MVMHTQDSYPKIIRASPGSLHPACDVVTFQLSTYFVQNAESGCLDLVVDLSTFAQVCDGLHFLSHTVCLWFGHQCCTSLRDGRRGGRRKHLG